MVNADGRREVLGMDIGPSEAEPFWAAFLRKLARRGLRGVKLVISSDAHSRAAFSVLRWGTVVARRAWLEPGHVLNTRPIADFKASLRRHRN